MGEILFERISRLCKEQNITVKKLSEQLGLSDSLLRKWKAGTSPSAEKLCAVADYFSVSVDYLLGRSNCRESAEDILEDSAMKELFRLRQRLTKTQNEKMMQILSLIFETEA